MPNPTISDLHISGPLTDISVSYAQANRGKFAAFNLFPKVPVQKKGDKYYVWTRADLLRSQAQRRAPGAEIAIGGVRLSNDSYDCDRWALGRDISDPERANSDAAVNPETVGVEFLTDQIGLACEVDWCSDFFTTSVWTGASSTTDMTGAANPASTATGFRYWSDVLSTPIEDIRGELQSVESRTGYRPNKLALGNRVWTVLADHPDLVARLKTGTAIVTRDLLASLLEIDQVVVLNAVRNSGTEGSTSDSYDYVAGKHALLLYTTPRPGINQPTAGYTFVWTGSGIPLEGVRVKRYRLERNESDRIEAETWMDAKKVAADLGAFFSGAVA